MIASIVLFITAFALMFSLTRILGGFLLSPLTSLFGFIIIGTTLGIVSLLFHVDRIANAFVLSGIGVISGNILGSEGGFGFLNRIGQMIIREERKSDSWWEAIFMGYANLTISDVLLLWQVPKNDAGKVTIFYGRFLPVC